LGNVLGQNLARLWWRTVLTNWMICPFFARWWAAWTALLA
jgi:hypothetical protein